MGIQVRAALPNEKACRRLVCFLLFAVLVAPFLSSAQDEIHSESTILDPPSTESDEQLPHAALIWYPGGLVNVSKYTTFVKDAQAKLEGKVRFWVCLVYIDWDEVMSGAPESLEERIKHFEAFYPEFDLTVDGLVPKLEAAGFKPLKEIQGNGTRYSNVITGGHSAGGIYAEIEASKSAGPLMLSGSGTELMLKNTDHALLEHPYPLLMFSGALDGQLPWMALIKVFVEAIQVGLVFGKKMAATRKNFALIPGMNHMQISEGAPRYWRGGIDADITTSEAISKCGDLVSAFVDMHFGAGDKQAPLAVLEKELFGTTMEVVKPYLEAAGLADVTFALKKIEEGNAGEDSVPWKRSNFIHYSEEDVAEEECARVQNLILSKSESNARVIPLVVEKLDNFLATKPLLLEFGGSEPPLVVPVCYIHRQPQSQRPAQRTPEYWMKLALSSDPTYSLDETPDEGNGAVSFQDFCSKRNSEMFVEAMKVATKSSLERYNSRGIPVRFGPDLVSKDSETPLEEWTDDKHGIQYTHDASSNTNVVRSPVLMGEDFVMVKTWGPARALEYLAFNALRLPKEEGGE